MKFFHPSTTLQSYISQYIAGVLCVCNLTTKYLDNKKLSVK